MQADRRTFLKSGLAFSLGGTLVALSPREARARGAELRVLTAGEARLFEALGETLAPGAAEAGFAHYLDAGLVAGPADSLLMIRYLNVPPPWVDFYRAIARALDDVARARFSHGFADIAAEQRATLVAAMANDEIAPWSGPPAAFAFFVLRNDAIDVVWGTEEGFARLGIDYRAHLPPETPW